MINSIKTNDDSFKAAKLILEGKYIKENSDQLYTKTTDQGTFYYKDKAMKILHNPDGQAIEYDGSKTNERWFLNGNLHREDGPAATYADGGQEWALNGETHREDGPAVIHADGSKEFWLYGIKISGNDLKAASRLSRDEFLKSEYNPNSKLAADLGKIAKGLRHTEESYMSRYMNEGVSGYVYALYIKSLDDDDFKFEAVFATEAAAKRAWKDQYEEIFADWIASQEVDYGIEKLPVYN